MSIQRYKFVVSHKLSFLQDYEVSLLMKFSVKTSTRCNWVFRKMLMGDSCLQMPFTVQYILIHRVPLAVLGNRKIFTHFL